MRYTVGKPDCPTCYGAGTVCPASGQMGWTDGNCDGPGCPDCREWRYEQMDIEARERQVRSVMMKAALFRAKELLPPEDYALLGLASKESVYA